jgi:hypothetical protein
MVPLSVQPWNAFREQMPVAKRFAYFDDLEID